jgi:hypothetical protein
MKKSRPPKGVLKNRKRAKGARREDGRSVGTDGTYIEADYVVCEAFRHLSPSAWKLCTMVLFRRIKAPRKPKARKKDYVTVNADELRLTYDVAMYETGLSEKTIARCFDELVEKGYLDVVRAGGGRCGVEAIYKLSDRYQLWHPDPEVRASNRFVEAVRERAPGHSGFENRKNGARASSSKQGG